MKWFLRRLLKLLYKIDVEISKESLNAEGIIICNHQSFLDGLLLGLFLPQNPIFVIDRAIADRWYFKFFLRFVSHVTVDPLHPMAMKTLLEKAKSDQSIVIFPEGRITLTGSFMKFYEGAAFIAHKTGKPLIPVIIEGAEQTHLSRLKGVVKQRLFTPIRIVMRPPVYVDLSHKTIDQNVRHYFAKFTQECLMNTRLDVFKPTSLFESIVNARKEFGKNTECVEDITRKPLSFQKLIEASLALSRVLARHTIEKERVGLLLPNMVPSAVTLLSLNAINRTSALLNYSAGIEGMDAAIVAADLKTIITSKRFLKEGKLEHFPESFPQIRWIYLEDLKKEITFTDKLWVLMARRNPMKHLPKVSPDDEAIILFTSGSEGKPKGVVHSNASILTNVEQLHTVADFTTKDTFMVALPLFHAFGLTAGFFTSVISGAKAFFYPSPLHYRVIPEMIYDIQATVFFGTSTFLQHYARYANPIDFASLRYVVAGAEKLSGNVKQVWQEKFGIRILEGYGATECAPVISINVPMDYKENTLGKLLPGIKAELLPVEGIENAGKLRVKGNNLMKGYLLYDAPGVLNREELDHNDGWYDTGDIVAIDEDGFLTIEGRAKRFAKIAGEMVALETAERVFRETYNDFEHAAVTREDQSKGEAIVVFTSCPDTDRKALTMTAKELGIPELAISRDVRFVQALPRLGSGKIDYKALTALTLQTDQSDSENAPL